MISAPERDVGHGNCVPAGSADSPTTQSGEARVSCIWTDTFLRKVADKIVTKQTSLPTEQVIERAAAFFGNEHWQVLGQSSRGLSFDGRVRCPWPLCILVVVGCLLLIVPGVLLYFLVVRPRYGRQELAATATPRGTGTEVAVRCRHAAVGLAQRFLAELPL